MNYVVIEKVILSITFSFSIGLIELMVQEVVTTSGGIASANGSTIS